MPAILTPDPQLAARCLRRGGVVLHATEGVWGFACDPLESLSVDRVIALKQRDLRKGLILIGAQAAQFSVHLENCEHADEVVASWPGAETWILPNRQQYSDQITGGRDTVACRVPGHPQARELCDLFGGVLVSTSANISGSEPVLTEREAWSEFSDQVDCVLRGEVLNPGRPSTIHALDGAILRGGS